jgi:hypothetical protein
MHYPSDVESFYAANCLSQCAFPHAIRGGAARCLRVTGAVRERGELTLVEVHILAE